MQRELLYIPLQILFARKARRFKQSRRNVTKGYLNVTRCKHKLQNLKMNEAKRRAATKYFEQEIWNNIFKQNSFQDRLLNLKYHKLGKDESVVVRGLDSEQLLMSRRSKKLRELMNSAETCKRSDHSKVKCPSQLATTHHLPTLPPCNRPLTTGQMIYLELPADLSADRRSRSHSALNAETKQTRQEGIYLPAMPCAEKPRRSSHSACSAINASLSDSEINKQRTRKTSWIQPSIQLHQRDELPTGK